MWHRLLALLSLCVVILITAAVTLSPANADLMLDCDVMASAPVPVPDAGHAHDHAAMIHADDHLTSADMKADHCESHACLMAIAALEMHPAAPLRLAQPPGLPSLASLIDLAIPEGLRRPPRA